MDAKAKAIVPLSLSGLEVFTGPKVWTDLKETIGKSTCTQRSQLSEKDRLRRDLRILRPDAKCCQSETQIENANTGSSMMHHLILA